MVRTCPSRSTLQYRYALSLMPSISRPATRKIEGRARGEAALRAGDPRDHRGNLWNREKAIHRDLGLCCRNVLRAHFLEKVRLGDDRCDAIDRSEERR